MNYWEPKKYSEYKWKPLSESHCIPRFADSPYFHPTCEHGMKVGRAGGEDDAMGEDLLVGDDEDDVAQLAMFAQHIDRLRARKQFRQNRSTPSSGLLDFLRCGG